MGKEDTKKKYKDNIKELRTNNWTKKLLHGQHPGLVADKVTKSTNIWIRNGYMKKETEGMLTAAQDQATPTKWRKKNTQILDFSG